MKLEHYLKPTVLSAGVFANYCAKFYPLMMFSQKNY